MLKLNKYTKWWSCVSWLIVLLAVGGLANAQDIPGLLPVTDAFKLAVNPSTPGVMTLHWTIAPQYYLYREQISVKGGKDTTLGTLQLPKGEKFRDNFFGDVEVYRNNVDVGLPYTVTPETKRVRFSVTYQGCHEVEPKICFPPHTETVDVPAPTSAAAGGGVTATSSVTGFMTALLLALAGGLILNLMPCVLPVLSIKAIGLLESGEDPAKRRMHALTYTAGVLCSFAAIGFAVLALRSAGHVMGWGAQLQQPLVVSILVCVIVALGLSMSGVVNLGASFGNVGQGLASRSSWVGDFFTGVLSVVVASPCVAPFMGTALAYAFVAPMIAALLVFLALGVGLALPFLLIGFIPALGRLLPRPGAWMETLKQVLAFPMYLTAVWLVWVVAHQRGADAVGLVLTSAVLLAMGLWLLERSRSRGMWARMAVVLALLAAAAPQYFVAHLKPVSSAAPTEQGIVPFSPTKLAELRRAGTPVFIDMTADWCITCKANEHEVLDTPQFHDLLARTGTVYMKGDWTNVDPTISAFLDAYHSPGVPLYVVFPKSGGDGVVLPNVLTFSLMQKALVDASK